MIGLPETHEAAAYTFRYTPVGVEDERLFETMVVLPSASQYTTFNIADRLPGG